MKKIFYAVLALVVFGIYSCQKDNSAPAKAGFSSGIAIKGKKDTTPPDPTFTTSSASKKDTTPPDPRK